MRNSRQRKSQNQCRTIEKGSTNLSGSLNISRAETMLLIDSDELNTIFSNIEWIRTRSYFGNQTRKPYLWIQMNGHGTSNIVCTITTDCTKSIVLAKMFKKTCFSLNQQSFER